MGTRITSNMLSSNYLRNAQRNLNNMKSLQNQLASGNKIQKASENPYIASRSMQLNAEISYNKQYDENIKDTTNWLETTDTALSQVGNVFARIQTLLVSAGNGAYGDDEKAAIQDEIKEKVNELSQILNTSFDGAYIFGGTKINSKPTTVVNGVLEYASTEGKTINPYLDAAGKVTSDTVSINANYNSTTPIYLDSNGKITTSSAAKDGTQNTQIIQGNSLYIDTGTGVVSTKASSLANPKPLLLKDELYTDLNGNITASKTTDNTLITSDNELFYLTSDGQVTTSPAGNTLIATGTTFYKQADGKVTTSATTATVPPVENESINASTPLYTDEQGFVTTSSVTANTSVSAGSINTLNVSTYTPATGYGKELINSSGDIYVDSRGILTNSQTTYLSTRGATLNNLWSNSYYIDQIDKKIKTAMPIPSPNNQINLYKDASGQVTTSPGSYPANEQILKGTNLYATSDGKVTTVAGVGTTPLQLTDTVYVDLDGKLTALSKYNNKAVSVRDTLSISTTGTGATANAVIGTVPASNTVIPSDTIKLYVDGSGKITNDGTGTGKTKIVLSDSLYLDSYENITVFQKTQNTLMDSDDKLYKDTNGNVTNSSSNTKVISGTTLYQDATGRITTLQGGTPPNKTVDLSDAVLYKDANGNVTTMSYSGTVANTLIDSSTSLYKDVNGNITTVNDNTLITSNVQLYKADDGSVITDPVGITALTTTLYKDASGNVTNIPIGSPATNKLLSSDSLYLDANGNIVTNQSTQSGVKNTPIPKTTKLYVDTATKQVKTNLIKTGEALYSDVNGKIVTSQTVTNTSLTAKDNIYVNAAGMLTMSETTANDKLTMTDVINLKKEYDDSNTTSAKKAEIKTILEDKNVAELVQIYSDLTTDISQGINVKYNKTAVDILEFKDKNGKNIDVSELFTNIIKALGSGGNASELTTTCLTDIQSVTSNLLQKRSEIGVMQNRMESAQENNEDQNYNMTDILSKTNDIDFAEVTMNYSMMQTVYTASLQTSAKILPMSILNYL